MAAAAGQPPNPDSDVRGGYRAMLVVYYDDGGTTFVAAGKESVYALERGISPPDLFNSQFIRRDATFDTADDAFDEFLNRRAAVATYRRVAGSEIHVPYPRLNSDNFWESRFRVRGDGLWGFPKGSQKHKDNGDAKITAIREFKEEIGADIPPDNITGYAVVQGHHVFFADVSGPANQSLRDEIAAAYFGHLEFSELFDIGWLNINNERPGSYKNRVTIDVAAILLENRGQIGPVQQPPAPAPAVQARGAVGAPNRYVPPHRRLGGKTRRTGRSKLGTKKRRTGGRGRKTRRSP